MLAAVQESRRTRGIKHVVAVQRVSSAIARCQHVGLSAAQFVGRSRSGGRKCRNNAAATPSTCDTPINHQSQATAGQGCPVGPNAAFFGVTSHQGHTRRITSVGDRDSQRRRPGQAGGEAADQLDSTCTPAARRASNSSPQPVAGRPASNQSRIQRAAAASPASRKSCKLP